MCFLLHVSSGHCAGTGELGCVRPYGQCLRSRRGLLQGEARTRRGWAPFLQAQLKAHYKDASSSCCSLPFQVCLMIQASFRLCFVVNAFCFVMCKWSFISFFSNSSASWYISFLFVFLEIISKLDNKFKNNTNLLPYILEIRNAQSFSMGQAECW